MRILMIDDERCRFDEFVKNNPHAEVCEYAPNFTLGVTYLASFRYDLVLLDHDLGEEKTGQDIVSCIANNASRFASTAFIVHSLNRPAAVEMGRTLKQAGLRAAVKPFYWQKPIT